MKPDWNRRFAAGLLAILLCLCSFSITHIHFIVHERLAKCCYIRSAYIL